MKLQNSRHIKQSYARAFMAVVVSAVSLNQVSCDRTVVAPADQPARLQRLLKYYDDHFDNQQQLLQVQFVSPGYHSVIARGTLVHPIRESFYYAVGLLQRGRTEDVSRSKVMLTQLLSLQQTQPNQPGYGAWPWLLEEPIEKMDSICLLYTSPSPRDLSTSRMPSSA